jgi:hypothetical protein
MNVRESDLGGIWLEELKKTTRNFSKDGSGKRRASTLNVPDMKQEYYPFDPHIL